MWARVLSKGFIRVGEECGKVVTEHHDSEELPEAQRVHKVLHCLDLNLADLRLIIVAN